MLDKEPSGEVVRETGFKGMTSSMNRSSNQLMTESFDIKGRWSLEQNSFRDNTNYVSGILRYDPERITLELIGTLSNNADCYFESKEVERVYGFSDNGESITLFECQPYQSRISAPGFATVSYYVQKVYVGCFLDSETEELPISVAFSFTNLDAWIRSDLVKRKYLGSSYRSISVDLNELKDELLRYENSAIRLSEDIKIKQTEPNQYINIEIYDISIEHFYHIEPIITNTITLQDCLKLINSIRKLLVVLTRQPMYYKYIDCYFVSNSVDDNSCNLRGRLFFNQIGNCASVKAINPNNRNGFLIRHSDIKDELRRILDKWFEDSKYFNEIVDSYVCSKYSREFVETEFLNRARELESYHRFFVENPSSHGIVNYVKNNDEERITKERNLIVDYINETIPKADRDYFIDRIDYTKEMTFGDRIDCLLKNLPEKLSEKLGLKDNPDGQLQLKRQIVHTRNYFTHRDDSKKYKHAVFQPYDLYTLTIKLETILQYYCLVEMGIQSELVSKCLLMQLNF